MTSCTMCWKCCKDISSEAKFAITLDKVLCGVCQGLYWEWQLQEFLKIDNLDIVRKHEQLK